MILPTPFPSLLLIFPFRLKPMVPSLVQDHPILEQNTYEASIPESFEVRGEVLVAKAVDLGGSSEYSTVS